MSLSTRQFFHVAPRSQRGSIDRHGIDASLGEPVWEESADDPGNYLWSSVRDARTYRSMVESLSASDDWPNYTGPEGERFDVYEVNRPGHLPAPALDYDADNAYVTAKPIPRSWVRRVE